MCDRQCRCGIKSCCEQKLFIGEPAPSFASDALMPDGSFKKVTLADFHGKYLVIFFYPLDFTFVCPTEIIAFSDRVEEFRKLKCEVLAVSCDSVYSHLAWTKVPRDKGGLEKINFPMLEDKNCEISRKYNILIADKGVSLRGLFLVDPKGILRQIIVNDLPVGRSVDETLRLLQAYQFADEHGEVCPINWKKGDKSLDPAHSEKYFSTAYKK